MTTVREFEDKKQEICDFVVKNIATRANVKHILHFNKMLDELQPPRPTCSTCPNGEIINGRLEVLTKIKELINHE